MKEYLDYLDLAKGIGILLVIMGHSLFPLHIAIDIFHMPLFFLSQESHLVFLKIKMLACS